MTKVEVDNRVQAELDALITEGTIDKQQQSEVEEKESKMNSNMNWDNIKNCFKHVGSYINNLSLVIGSHPGLLPRVRLSG